MLMSGGATGTYSDEEIRTLGTAIGNMTRDGGITAAFDGTTTGDYQVSARLDGSNGCLGAWIGKNFGEEVNIRKVTLYRPDGNGSSGSNCFPGSGSGDSDLQYSDDGSSWTTAKTQVSTSAKSYLISDNGADVSKQYWRVLFVGDVNGGSVRECAFSMDTDPPGSVEFDGSGDYLTVPSSSDLTFGTGDFTVEMWVYANNFTNRGTFYDSRGSASLTGMVIGHESSTGKLKVYMNPAGGEDQIVESTDFSTGSWYHVAVTCDSTTVRLFVNGVLKDTGTGRNLSNTEAVNIGYKTYTSSGYDYLDGFISNVRVLKGTALYTSNFTVPTSALTNVTNTKLLCCQSSNSATIAAVTPGTIVATGAVASSDDPF